MRAGTSVMMVLGVAGCDHPNDNPIEPPDRWALSWSDEFDGAPGSAPDSSKWALQTGTGPDHDGWGNAELETYTARPENVALDGAGNLVITARRESFDGAAYT